MSSHEKKVSLEHQVDILLTRMVLNEARVPPGLQCCETCDGLGFLWPVDPRAPEEECEFCNGTGESP